MNKVHKAALPNGRLACLLALGLITATYGDMVPMEKKVGTNIDVGQAFKKDDKQPLSRTGVYLTAGGVYNEKLDVKVTTGGLFWYAFPELTTASRVVKFGPGIGQAQARYAFGEASNPAATLQFGLFSVKYNSDSKNLGEYLYRSGTYPGHIWTGGWSYINSASYMAQGLRLNFNTMGDRLAHEFSLFMTREAIAPINDFSPGYLINAKLGSGFEIGGGVVWSNALSFKPSRLTPKNPKNAYSNTTKLPVFLATDSATLDSTSWEYYTFRGFKVMLRGAVDFNTLLDMNKEETGEFRLYTEAALLGVEDQPYYYERKADRIPVMAGVSLPTFGLLDQLNFEVERFASRYPNTIYYPFDSQDNLPIPLGGDGEESFPSQFSDSAFTANKKHFTKDDYKWSLYAKRNILEGVNLHVQCASDHFRPNNSEAKFMSKPFTERPQEWYYIVRLEFGIF